MSFPLSARDGHLLGVVSAHWREPGTRDPRTLAPLVHSIQRRLATAAEAIPGRDLATRNELELQVDNLEAALWTRSTIAQAQGILMARQGISADAAFDILRRVSQRTNRKIRDVALEIVDRHTATVRRPPSQFDGVSDQPPSS